MALPALGGGIAHGQVDALVGETVEPIVGAAAQPEAVPGDRVPAAQPVAGAAAPADPAPGDRAPKLTAEEPQAEAADSGGEEIPDPQAGDPTLEGAGNGDGGFKLIRGNAKPQKIFWNGPGTVFSFELGGYDGAKDIVVKVVDKGSGNLIKRWPREAVRAHTHQEVKWGGTLNAGEPAPKGEYRFQVFKKNGPKADASDADGDQSVKLYLHIFPVRGPHTYGDGIGAGRGHQGVDIAADCGIRLEAARGGQVQWKAYQGGGAGNYVVIDGRRTGRDYVYMHLLDPALVGEGERVHTGEKIGEVGSTGSSTGCHLHFELWSPPGWYEGGHFTDPWDELHKWDRWS